MLIPTNIIIWLLLLLPLAAAGLHSDSLLMLFIFGAVGVISVAIVDAVIGFRKLRGVSICFPDVCRFSQGKEGTLKFRVTNPYLQKLVLRVMPKIPEGIEADLDGFELSVPAEERVRGVWELTPQRRGNHRLNNCLLEVASPLNFWQIRKKEPVAVELRVYPNLQGERKKLAAVFMNRGYVGMHLHRLVGQGREFEKLRDYIPGDSYDIISWKATAKRHRPISKDFQLERTQEVYVVIDQSRLSSRTITDTPSFEYFIASALTLGLVVEKQADLFGLIVFDDQVRKFIRAKGGKGHHLACREVLYTMEPENRSPDYGELFSFIKANLRRRALLLFLTDIDEPNHMESFVDNIRIISGKHLCVANSMKEAYVEPLFEGGAVENTEEIYSHLAGHLNWGKFVEVQRRLQYLGVRLNLVKPDDLTLEIISSYLDIKRKQRL